MADNENDDGRKVVAVLKSTDMQQRFREALPANVSIDKFTRVVATAVAQRPELLRADRTSLYLACTRAAQDGLLPDGREGVLNIYKTNVGSKERPQWVDKVQWMPMVEGVIKQMGKAGIRVVAASVYEADKFRFWVDGDGQHLEHDPSLFSADRGTRVGAYAIGTTSDGWRQIEVMNAAELAKAKAASKNRDGKIHELWGDRMEQKTVIHRLRKRMAINDDSVQEFLDRDLQDSVDDDNDVPEVPVRNTGMAGQEAKTEKSETRRSKTLQAVVDHQKQAAVSESARDNGNENEPVAAGGGSTDDF